MSNIPEYSVSELSHSIKSSLESKFNRVKVKGEISGFTKANSGHLYFNLKDEGALLSSIIWRSRVALLDVIPEEGIEVIALGRISTYMPRSNYNFIIDNIKVAGEGALLKIIEERKKKLKNLGYFEETIKKKLPFLPKTIGIITSPTGAVIEDMKKKIKERYPSNILLWSVAVQGPKSESDIVKAIDGFNFIKNKPDVIILARGGGSLEDLFAFNSEEVARAIFNSNIPLISAVGHETDFSICDLVADIRASTPTAAADLVVPEREELYKKVETVFILLKKNTDNILNMKYFKLDNNCNKLLDPKLHINLLENKISDQLVKFDTFFSNYFKNFKYLLKTLNIMDPIEKIKERRSSFNSLIKYFTKNSQALLEKKKTILDNQIKILNSCSYERWLEKGFVVVKDMNNNLVKKMEKLKNDESITIKFSDGPVEARIKKKDEIS
jgi:exodeoxyribonuclease VII large subunit